jgi:hypothetical protein
MDGFPEACERDVLRRSDWLEERGLMRRVKIASVIRLRLRIAVHTQCRNGSQMEDSDDRGPPARPRHRKTRRVTVT